jgi:hypothetical protein
MAIITDITNSNPLTQAILAGSQEAPSVKLPMFLQVFLKRMTIKTTRQAFLLD